MSLGVTFQPASVARSPFIVRLALAAAAIVLATALIAALAWAIAPGLAAPPPRSPFNLGFREAAPAATGLAGWLLALQSSFSRSLEAAVSAIREGGGWQTPALIGFSYGVLHAAGPGHGKAVIAGYIIAGERTLLRGFGLSLAAALLQAAIPIVMVGLGWYLFAATRAGMNQAGTAIETASFALVVALGALVTLRKSDALAALATGTSPTAACAPGCSHAVLADADAVERLGTWRERIGVIVAAGSRPCFGAVSILTLSAAQGIFSAGIVATLAMALGTALTTGALASLAVFAKGLALQLAGGRSRAGALAIGGIELLAGAFVLVLGLAMLCGWALGLGG